MLSNRDWVINIENAAATVAAEYGQKVVDSVFCRYDAHSFLNTMSKIITKLSLSRKYSIWFSEK